MRIGFHAAQVGRRRLRSCRIFRHWGWPKGRRAEFNTTFFFEIWACLMKEVGTVKRFCFIDRGLLACFPTRIETHPNIST